MPNRVTTERSSRNMSTSGRPTKVSRSLRTCVALPAKGYMVQRQSRLPTPWYARHTSYPDRSLSTDHRGVNVATGESAFKATSTSKWKVASPIFWLPENRAVRSSTCFPSMADGQVVRPALLRRHRSPEANGASTGFSWICNVPSVHWPPRFSSCHRSPCVFLNSIVASTGRSPQA